MILLESRDVKFRVQYPNTSGHEVELAGTVAILGRDPSCDLVLNDVKCSRRHAVVEAGPQGLAIRDTGSANGVFLNGKKVDRSPLNEGDVFRLGDVLLMVLPEDTPGTLVMGAEELGKAPRNTETVPPQFLPIGTIPRARPEPHRPLTLTVLAILWMISVVLYPAAGLAAARSGAGASAVLAMVAGVLLAVVSAGMAFGLWTRRPGARRAQIGTAALGLLLCPFTLASAVVLAYMLRPATAAHFSNVRPLGDAAQPDTAELTFTGLVMATVVLGTLLAAGTVFFLRATTTALPPR
jgi:pSer/pThr/pTyr-binding forkhead associated (FHA) protein